MKHLLPLFLLLAACPPPKRISTRQPTVGLERINKTDPKRVRVHAIDVGQGAAAIIEFPCAAILVDTGGEQTSTFDSNRALKNYLDAFFERRTDLNRTFAAVYITHPHIDHTRGLPMVMKDYVVQHLITNGQPRGTDGLVLESGGENQEAAEADARARNVLRTVSKADVSAGGITDANIDPISCGELDPKISILWGGLKNNTEGWEPKIFQNANNHSLVIKVDVAGHPILITGDLETEAINALLTMHGDVLNSDVLFVGHHGSYNGTTMSLVKTVTPCMAVVSMGDMHHQEDWTAWAYGHPRKVAVDLVAHSLGCSRPSKSVSVALGVRRFEEYLLDRALYGTGWEGSVVLDASAGGGWKAATER